MLLNFQTLVIEFPQKEIPKWAPQVERWYQLDAYAFSLSQALHQHTKKDFQKMVLASPGASTETDFQFASNDVPSPQKFVHTLPNVRASMALQAIGQKSELICLQNGSYTINTGIEEFFALSTENEDTLFASCINLDFDYSSKSPKNYGVIIFSQSLKGTWKLEKKDNNKVEDRLLIKEIFVSKNTLDLGQWQLEKVSE